MRRVAGTRCVLAALALALAGLTACTDDQPHTLVAAGAGAESVGEPIPTTSTSTSVTTTSMPVANMISTVAAPSAASTATATPAPTAPPVTPPVFLQPPLEPGVEPWGYGDYGGSKTVTSGSTTVTMSVYPRSQYAGQVTDLRATVQFVGGVTSFHIDFGDGTVSEGYQYPTWLCDGNMAPKTTGAAEPEHVYAQPGRYTVTATVTTADCSPTPTVPGVPVATFPAHIYPRPVSGPVQTTTVTMTAISRPDRLPAPGPAPVIADCPPQAGGC